MILLFVLGIAIGRWSAPKHVLSQAPEETITPAASSSHLTAVENEQAPQEAKEDSLPQNISANAPTGLIRTDKHVQEKQMRELFNQLQEAKNKDNIEEQNRLFTEMEKLDPKHEKVFEAKVTFLQDDDNWNEAYNALKECVTVIPNSKYCLRRITNIRSSTTEDKIRYGLECLQTYTNDPLCLVDLAIALHSKGDFETAKIYFERALALKPGTEGFDRDYILIQYAGTLERLNQTQKAKAAYQEACKLQNKSACKQLRLYNNF